MDSQLFEQRKLRIEHLKDQYEAIANDMTKITIDEPQLVERPDLISKLVQLHLKMRYIEREIRRQEEELTKRGCYQ